MNRPIALLRALGADLLDLFAPRACAACGAAHPSYPPGPRHAPALCAVCACDLCPAEDPPPGVITPFAHGASLARAIHRAKYGADPSPARQLGALLAHAVGADLPAHDRVVPVPLHGHRLAARGFNQAVEIARAFGLPIAHGAVTRTRDTPSQVGLGRAARVANVAGAFVARNSAASTLAGLRVLVVDDVVTTGATLANVAAAARAAGATSVTCVALARAPLEHPTPPAR